MRLKYLKQIEHGRLRNFPYLEGQTLNKNLQITFVLIRDCQIKKFCLIGKNPYFYGIPKTKMSFDLQMLLTSAGVQM